MTTQDWILLGTLALCIGGPTTIGGAIAVRLAIRGGIGLARSLAAGAATGGVATAAAFIYMMAQGGDGVPGFPGIDRSDLEVETLVFSFEEVGGELLFRFQDRLFPLDRTEYLLIQANQVGHAREIHVHDNVGHTGGMILQLRNLAQTFGFQFSILDAEALE